MSKLEEQIKGAIEHVWKRTKVSQPLVDAVVYVVDNHLASQQQDLLNRIEKEVVGEDDRDYSQDNADEESLRILVATSTACNELRATQRQALNKIRKEIE